MWVAGVGVIGSALIGAAASTAVSYGASALAGGGDGAPGVYDQYAQGPNYQNNQDVSNQWKDWLTTAGSDPNYGAISPDWNDIWQQTQQQVKNYYEGTATTPGVNDAIKGSFAQRGMGGQAGETFALSASGANEAQQLGNASAAQNIAKQNFANQGKNDWLGSMSNYINGSNNGAGNWSGAIPYATTAQQNASNMSAIGGGLVTSVTNGIQKQQEQDWLTSLLKNNNSGGGGGGSSGTSIPDFQPVSMPSGSSIAGGY